MLISHITPDHIDQEVTFQGRIDQKRGSGKIQFIVLRDGTGYLETVISLQSGDPSTGSGGHPTISEGQSANSEGQPANSEGQPANSEGQPANSEGQPANSEGPSTNSGEQLDGGVSLDEFEAVKGCGIESVIELTGILKKHFKKENAYELQVTQASVLNIAKDYPLGQKDHGVEFLFDMRHLYLRSKSQRAILRIRDTIIHATYDWMRNHDYTKIDSPIFTPTCAEDSTELYEVTHTNDEKMFLSQTGQMYIEAAIAGHRNVYDFGPVFRAEKSKTRRHLNELWMMDAETAFCDNNQNMDIQEALVKFIMAEVIRLRTPELEILGRDISLLQKTVDHPFPRKTHAEVVKELQGLGSDIQAGEDLGADDEEILMNQYQVPMFVTNFPLEIKAFYMPEDPLHPGTAKCADMLAPEGYGEVIGGSEREFDYATLKQKVLDRGYDLKDYDWYLDIRKYGGVKTSGFGFGLERLVRWIAGLHHIRETIPFPRYHNRITP